ncbi:MAG: hypothetical protein KDC38_09365, partial [Planctomycetes bacterium]|nr:hypothetical protein [Planctomycetota bacterium]
MHARTRLAVGGALLLGVLSGCMLPSRGPRSETVVQREFQLLDRPELQVPLEGAPIVWVTNQRKLQLSFETDAYLLPSVVSFYARSSPKASWTPIGEWRPRQPSVEWSPPDEGRWEITADEGGTREFGLRSDPRAVVVVDWTPPEVTVERGLPATPVKGGGTIPLRWSVKDFLYGSESVVVEMAEGSGETWKPVAEVPNSGVFDWPVGNRSMTGARLRLAVTDVAGNARHVPVPGRLTVIGESPVVLVEGELVSGESRVAIPYSTTSETALARVELWITADQGATWLLAGFDSDVASPLELELEPGRWGYELVFVDRDGNRSAQPIPGFPPQRHLVVDITAPVVEWGEPLARRVAGVSAMGPDAIAVAIPYRIIDDTLYESTIAARSQVGGLWMDLPGEFTAEGTIELEHPAISTPLKVRLTGLDRAGHSFESTCELWPLEMVDPPRIEFTDVPTGWNAAGSAVVLGYRTEWEPSLERPVDLAYSVDGQQWVPIASDL